MDSSQELPKPNNEDRDLRDEIRLAKPVLDRFSRTSQQLHSINILRKHQERHQTKLSWEEAQAMATVEALALVLNNPKLREEVDISKFCELYRLYRSIELHSGKTRGGDILMGGKPANPKDIINHFYALYTAPPSDQQILQLLADHQTQNYWLDKNPDKEVQLIKGILYLYRQDAEVIQRLPQDKIKTIIYLSDWAKTLPEEDRQRPPKTIDHLLVFHDNDKNIAASQQGRSLLRILYSSIEEIKGYVKSFTRVIQIFG
ncbi:MAG: hypothetical protein QHH09_02320 [Microgenomates group bacterium]|nr:hypothetical protein [Microgenomates group bacterium]